MNFKEQNKTGFSEAAAATVITSGVLGLLPFTGIDVNAMQATNLGLFLAAVIGFSLRKYKKWRKRNV